MNTVVAAYPEREIHVVLDNLSTHKPTRDLWLKRHKTVHFHYTPTHASWLSQIEIWFSILTTKSLASFTSVPQTHRPHRRLHRRLQSDRSAVRLNQIRGPSKTP
jgi:transposase